MKCILTGTVVGKGVITSKKDNKEYPWVDVYSDGECSRVFGFPTMEFSGLAEGEVIEWPVRITVNDNGRLGVRYIDK